MGWNLSTSVVIWRLISDTACSPAVNFKMSKWKWSDIHVYLKTTKCEIIFWSFLRLSTTHAELIIFFMLAYPYSCTVLRKAHFFICSCINACLWNGMLASLWLLLAARVTCYRMYLEVPSVLKSVFSKPHAWYYSNCWKWFPAMSTNM